MSSLQLRLHPRDLILCNPLTYLTFLKLSLAFP
jgi:hypothetical protein